MTGTLGRNLAKVSRGTRVTASLTALLPEVVASGSDSARRVLLGQRLRRVTDDLDGIFPWIADELANIPVLAGPAISSGLRSSNPPSSLGPFFRSVPLRGNGGWCLVSPAAAPATIDMDLGLLRPVVRLLRALTGPLCLGTTDSVLELVAEQVRAESSLPEELIQRRHLVRSCSTFVRCTPLTQFRDGRYVEFVPVTFAAPPVESVAGLKCLVAAWQDTVSLGIALPRMDWVNCRLGDTPQSVVIRHVAGAAPVTDYHRTLVKELGNVVHASEFGSGPLAEALARELGARSASVRELSLSIASVVLPAGDAQALGPLRFLRALDQTIRNSDATPRLTRGFFLIVRQLLAFRAMSDALGGAGSRCPTDPKWL